MIQYSQQKSKCGRQTGAASVIFTRCANRQVTLSVQGVDRKRDEYKGCGGTIHMEKTNEKYGAYIQILREELIPAMGCTEPIAVAYAAAVARQTLGELPDKVIVGASGSIIKNVKSVIVPNTDNMKGLNTAAAAGIVAGKPEKELEVIAEVTPEQTEEIKEFLKTAEITVEHVENGNTFDIVISVFKGEKSAKVRIANYHTNIVYIEKNGEVLKNIPVRGEAEDGLTDRNLLNMKDIWDFANTVDIESRRSATIWRSPRKVSGAIMERISEASFLIWKGII